MSLALLIHMLNRIADAVPRERLRFFEQNPVVFTPPMEYLSQFKDFVKEWVENGTLPPYMCKDWS